MAAVFADALLHPKSLRLAFLVLIIGITITAPAVAEHSDDRHQPIPVRLYLQAGSYHFDNSNYEFTNITPGLTLEAGERFIGALGGYRNSVRTFSAYAALGYRALPKRRVRPFAALGVIWGYHHSEPDPDGVEVEVPAFVALPVVGIDTEISERVAIRFKALYPVVSGGVVFSLN